jgi:hypothetical protein
MVYKHLEKRTGFHVIHTYDHLKVKLVMSGGMPAETLFHFFGG